MIYLVFTQDGFEQAKQSIVDDKATLWINPAVLTDQQSVELADAEISVNLLDPAIDPANEKAIFAAIDFIEKESSDTELFVEYL